MRPKNIFLAFLAFLPFISFGQPAWERVTPLPQEHTINHITKIPGTNKLIAVGWGSTVMISENAGESWEFYYHPADMNNNYFGSYVYFLDQDIGFIAGLGRTILKTTNGGYDWEMVYTSGIYNWVCYDYICFADENNGFAVGWGSEILKTNDGGNSWYVFETGFDFSFNAIAFCNQTKGYIVGSSGEYIVETNDGGNTWALKDFDPVLVSGNLSDICFVNDTTGFITCIDYTASNSDGIIYKSTDAGETWFLVYTHTWNMPRAIDFFDENNGIAGCERIMYESAVLITNDGGSTWNETILPVFSSYCAQTVSCYAPVSYICAGNMGLMCKSDGGANNWVPLHQREFYGDILQVQDLDEDNLFALAINGSGGVPYYDLKKSADGGETWDNIAMIIGIAAFDFLNPDVGFLATFDYFEIIIIKTENGGTSWAQVSATGFDFEPNTCEFYDEIHGIVTGENIMIITSDGGYTWVEVSDMSYDNTCTDVYYKSENEVFVCGSDGSGTMISKSLDGGNTWSSVFSGDFGLANDIEFVNPDIGIVACNNMAILKTTDGGNSWYETTVNCSNNIYFKSINFPSPDIGYAVGEGLYETIVKTTDGGETWDVIETNHTSAMNSVCFYDELNGYVFGNNGVVLKTNTGGVTGIEEANYTCLPDLVNAFPNPFANTVSIIFNPTKKWGKGQIIISDQLGETILTCPVDNSMKQINIPGQQLNPGIYFYQLKTDNGTGEVKKMIKL